MSKNKQPHLFIHSYAPFLVGLFLLAGASSHAQPRNPLMIGVGFTANSMTSDLNGGFSLKSPDKQEMTVNPGISVRLYPAPKHFLSPVFGFGFGNVVGQRIDLTPIVLADSSIVTPSRYVSTTLLNSDFSLRANFVRGNQFFHPYLQAGIGGLSFFARDMNDFPLVLDRESRTPDEFTYRALTYSVPLGAGADFRLSSTTNFNLSYQYRFTGSDYLDNIGVLGARAGNDRIQSLQVGLNLKVGGQAPSKKPYSPIIRDTDVLVFIPSSDRPPLVDGFVGPTLPPYCDSLAEALAVQISVGIAHEQAHKEEITRLKVQYAELLAAQYGAQEGEVAKLKAERDSLAGVVDGVVNISHYIERENAYGMQLFLNDSLRRMNNELHANLINITTAHEEMARAVVSLSDENEDLKARLRLAAMPNPEAQARAQREVDSMATALAARLAAQTIAQRPTNADSTRMLAIRRQQLTTREQQLDKRIADVAVRELEIVQLRQMLNFVSQSEPLPQQDVFAVESDAIMRDKPWDTFLATNGFKGELQPNGVKYYYSVSLPEIAASPLRIRTQVVKLSNGKHFMLFAAQQNTDGKYIARDTQPDVTAKLEALLKGTFR